MAAHDIIMAAAGASGPPTYIEDVFSTWLYTGNGSTQTINNGIDLAGKGGLVWLKSRSNALNNVLIDSARGASGGIYKPLFSNLTNAENTAPSYGVTSLNADGFSLGPPGSQSITNESGYTYASWTFRKQPKFFDVVTWTGNSTANRAIAHSLGSTPGCIIVKKLDSAVTNTPWCVWHRSLAAINAGYFAYLNTTDPYDSGGVFNAQLPTSTEFYVGNNLYSNYAGSTYVAYVFAHNAGGFGLTGTDNVISCGSYTGTGTAGLNVTLGYEPQWVMVKNATTGGYNWLMFDTMRGMSNTGSRYILADSSSAEGNAGLATVVPTATGFTIAVDSSWSELNNSGNTYIYIAIRRGPMKTPTTGTSVFSPITANSPTGTKLTTNFPVDLSITQERTSAGGAYWMDRLRGALSPGQTGNTPYLQSSNTGAETPTTITSGWDNTGLNVAYFGGVSAVWWNFRRAPGFFDEVCYTGTGSARTVAHNLGVVPELMIVKRRDTTGGWLVYSSTLGATKYLVLQGTNAEITGSTIWNDTAPTSSLFTVGTAAAANGSGGTYVAYLFASCPGVSKVGSYTGNGNTAAQGGQTINCGFTGSARFILIKCTSSAENWYVYDSARGIVTGNDPSLTLNTTEPEDTGYDAVDAVAGGFIVNNNNASNLNTSGQTYIYLAIA